MFDWFDLMRQAQTSAAQASLAQQFNLSNDQTQDHGRLHAGLRHGAAAGHGLQIPTRHVSEP